MEVAEEKKEETAGVETPEDPVALKKMLEDERAKSAEYLDNWRRAAADMSNYRKRMEKDAGEMTRLANSVLIARLLPVLDDFDRAQQTIPDNLRDLTWIDGVMLIARKMNAILESEGLKPIEALDKPFDPNVHEAVIHEETDQHEEGTVVAELQKGYKLSDRVLRPTLVKVAKKKASSEG
ncbi:MAG: nucleotide exchange factor GrpE [Chloroflexi bacterium]|nr:nucleotide exchange factor GrpE [Chloroflexota bacterium]